MEVSEPLTPIFSVLQCAGCGLYVLSVDDNPAKSDGRLRPGDEVIQVSLC